MSPIARAAVGLEPRSALLSLAFAASVLAQQEPQRVTDGEALRQALNRATPGTTIVMAPGDYQGFAVANVRGTAAAPITVRAEKAAQPPHFTSSIQLSDVEHFELDGLLLTGSPDNGLNLDDGGTFATPSHHVVLRHVTVRGCRFEHAGERAVQLGGSTGRDYFRPAPQGFEAKDLVVEGCTFVGSMAPIAFVGCDGATVRFNTIHLPQKWVLRILQETRDADFVPCRNGSFTDNLIVCLGIDDVVNIGPDTAPATFAFARNYWFRVDAPERSAPRLPVAEQQPGGGEDPRFVDAGAGDLRLRPDSCARRCGAEALPQTAAPLPRK